MDFFFLLIFPKENKEDQEIYQSQLKSFKDVFDMAMYEIISMKLKASVEH